MIFQNSLSPVVIVTTVFFIIVMVDDHLCHVNAFLTTTTARRRRQQQQQQQHLLRRFVGTTTRTRNDNNKTPYFSPQPIASSSSSSSPLFSMVSLGGGGDDFSSILQFLDKDQHPLSTIVCSYLLVTASDMVPFVPCQPLAIALGAKLGVQWAFPITAAGQTTAGIIAFSTARKASQSKVIQDSSLLNKIKNDDPQTFQKFQELQRLTSEENTSRQTILLALMGLRVAPFFPFSAGNYLLGGATAVPLSLFTIATIFGCLASNLLSTTVGAGAATVFLPPPQQ